MSSTYPEERLKNLPMTCGVYLMKDADGTVIYVGKAKNLKTRVRSYFSGADERYSIEFLLDRIATIETIVTEDERQALVLEADLIRKYKPRYNIRLKDDRAYLMVRIDLNQAWPRLELVRSSREDGATYLGPYVYGYELRTLMDIIERTVPLRTCTDNVLSNRVRPCLEYQIKRCAGPCCLDVDRQEYQAWIEQAIKILKGKNREVIVELEKAMEAASAALCFEEAATIRDRLSVLKRVKKDSPEANFGSGSRDAFGLYREGGRVELAVLIVRHGRLFGARTFGFPEAAVPSEELLSSVVTQYYAGDVEIPDEVLLPFPIEDADVHEGILREKRGSKMIMSVPKAGSRARLLSLAVSNARENFAARFSEVHLGDVIAKELQRELELEELPRTIECVDISHFQGGQTVGSVVAFEDGRPEKSRYRRFILSQEGKPDDFASMREIVGRHLSRCAEENTLADLMVIDGGPAQLSQALQERKKLSLTRPIMIGLAKERTVKLPARAHVGGLYAMPDKKPERIYREMGGAPIVLSPESETIHLLARIRDEAHRFAITFHRARRKRRTFRSELDGIQGVGTKRKTELLRAFGSIRAIREATPEDIQRLCGVPLRLAERIIKTLEQRLAAKMQTS